MKKCLSLVSLCLLSACASIPPQSVSQMEQLIDQQLAQIPQGVAGKKEAFLLVVAGFDEPAVFSNELQLAATQIGGAFDVQNRILRLSNNRKDAGTLPQVSPFMLKLAVQKLANKMNLDEDLFVIYVVSHGSKQGLVLKRGTDQPVLSDVVGLQDAFEQAGVQWKAVFVSACYSGVYLDRLKGDKTLIMTAADAENPSFGCGFGYKYTYFGSEFMDNRDFSRPIDWSAIYLDISRKIKKRESLAGLRPSNPQFAMGDAMANYLKNWPTLEVAKQP